MLNLLSQFLGQASAPFWVVPLLLLFIEIKRNDKGHWTAHFRFGLPSWRK